MRIEDLTSDDPRLPTLGFRRFGRGRLWIRESDGLVVPRVAGAAGTPEFFATINHGAQMLGTTDALVSGAPTSTANPKTLVTAGASGSKIDSVTLQAAGTSVKGVLLIWTVLDSGPTFFLWRAFKIDAVTYSNSTPTVPFFRRWDFSDYEIPTGYSVRASHDSSTAGNDTNVLAVHAAAGDA